MPRSKNSEDENVNPQSLERVIKLLEPTEPGVKNITKKEACNILQIAYNTTRLGTLIEKYKEKKAKDAERRTVLRGKPATKEETIFIIQEYLEGSTIENISNSTFRGNTFIKYILESNNVPLRAASQNYFKPELIPEGAMREEFAVGETVYSARYDSVATIDAIFKGAYRIWLKSERWLQYAYQEAAELASLKHLKALGVKI